MDFIHKENETELEGEENDIEEAMLDELTDDAEVDTDEDTLANDTPGDLEDEDDEDADDESDEVDDFFEEDAEDVDFDSFDDEDHL